MKSLFWRYLLTQWAALVLLLVLTIGLTTYVSTQRVQALRDLQPTGLVLNAMRIAAQQGEEGLKNWAKEIRNKQVALTIYLLDANDKDILGQEIHPRLVYSLKLARKSSEHHQQSIESGASLTWWQSHLLTMPDGQKLRLVFLPFDNSRWDLVALNHISLTLFAVALLITFGLCWLMTRHVAQPIEQLSQTTRRLAAGQLKSRAPSLVSQRKDTLGQLARDFDTMATRIQSQLEIREQLLRHVAHELRSPLTRLQIAVELASHKDDNLDLQLQRIVRESERLETRLKHTLQLARMSELAGPATTLNLIELIDEIVIDSRYETQSQTLLWRAPASAVLIEADRNSLYSALENVIRNAVQYSGENATIQIEVIPDKHDIKIRVRDNGTSLSDIDLETMFEPFQRGSAHRHLEGSGLGLSIARACIRAHGGDIQARLLDAQQGLEVQIQLPITPLDIH